MTCECECHGHGLDHPCSIEGGCGHLHPVHRCARNARCAERESVESDDGRKWLGRVIAAPGICTVCRAKVASSIRALADDVDELTKLIPAGSGTEGEFVSGSHELSVPIRLGIDALRTEIDSALSFWAHHIWVELGDKWSTADAAHSRQRPRVDRACTYVANRVETLVGLPMQKHPAWDAEGSRIVGKACTDTGLDGALYLLELHHRAYRVAGRTKLVHRLTPACPWCDHPTLVRDNGSDKVHCENPQCRMPDGKRHEIEEKHYNWFVGITIAEQQRNREQA